MLIFSVKKENAKVKYFDTERHSRYSCLQTHLCRGQENKHCKSYLMMQDVICVCKNWGGVWHASASIQCQHWRRAPDKPHSEHRHTLGPQIPPPQKIK